MYIDFPFQIDGNGRTASTNLDDHVRDLIEQFLFTNHGERVNRPDFGSGLLHHVFEPNSPELASALQFTVQAGLQQWLGDVLEVQALSVRAEDEKLTVTLTYQIRATGDVRTVNLSSGGTP